MTIVAQHADQAAFDKLHAIAKSSANETEVRRYYGALGAVRDPSLMRQALAAIMSPEIPPNDPAQVWAFYKQHLDELNASRSEFERALSVASSPGTFWDAAPLDELQSFVAAHDASAPAPFVARGMESARFALALRDRLVPAADAYVARYKSGSR